jgi:hypothetical protein
MSPVRLPQNSSVQENLGTPGSVPRGGGKRTATDMLESSPTAARPGKSSKRTRVVSFASEAKHNDGDETEQIFEDWAKDQQGGDNQFTPAEAAQFLPPKAHPANQNPKPSKKSTKTKTKELQGIKVKEKKKPRATVAASAPREPLAYVTYLEQFHTSRGSWKFNKSKQTDLLQNLFNIFRVPPSQDPAIFDYLKGLQGEGACQRLRERAHSMLEETGANGMANNDTVAQARQDALRHQLKGAKKRLLQNAEAEDAESDDSIIKVRQRKRAKTVLDAIGHELETEGVKIATHTNVADSLEPASKRRKTRKRNVRTGMSDDDDSESSSDDSISSSDVSDSSSLSSPSSESEDEDEEDESGEGSSDSDSDDASSSVSSSTSSGSSSSSDDEEEGSDSD